MRKLNQLLNDAESIINSECDSTTPEFRALEALLAAMDEIATTLGDIQDDRLARKDA